MGNDHSKHASGDATAAAPRAIGSSRDTRQALRPVVPGPIPPPPPPPPAAAAAAPPKAALHPYMRREIADEGRELFRRFAAHLDTQARKAPHLGDPAASAHRDFGSTAASASFLARFKFLEVVGAGSYSTVHRAIEKSTRRPVAIKVIKKEILSTSVEAQIKNEAAMMKACSGHRNIVELIAFEEFGSEMYFVMEYVPSTLLRSVLEGNERSVYSEAFAAAAIRQTAAALAHIHSKGIVHLDIKPDNLLLASGCSMSDAVDIGWFPEVKLADFGMAARVPVRRTVGTLFYVAPEILTEGWADQAADMWSLGVVMYVLLCGFPPFMPPGKLSSRPIESQITSGSYAFYSPYWDGVSAEAKDLIARLLVVDPGERLTAKDMLGHPWLHTASPAALSGVRERLAELPAKKRFQRGVHMVTSMLRMSHGHGSAPHADEYAKME